MTGLWLFNHFSICQLFVSYRFFFSGNESHKRGIACFNYWCNFFFSSGRSRQVQNLRDELYQSKLRLEKETSSLKEANKVRFEFSKFLSGAMYEENKLNTRIVATIQELYSGCTINKQNHRKVFQASIVDKSSWHFVFHDISYFLPKLSTLLSLLAFGIFNKRLIS